MALSTVSLKGGITAATQNTEGQLCTNRTYRVGMYYYLVSCIHAHVLITLLAGAVQTGLVKPQRPDPPSQHASYDRRAGKSTGRIHNGT